MKRLDRTKFTVLILGTMAVVISLIGVLFLNLKNFVFPLFMGVTLIGTGLLHNGQNIKSID